MEGKKAFHRADITGFIHGVFLICLRLSATVIFHIYFLTCFSLYHSYINNESGHFFVSTEIWWSRCILLIPITNNIKFVCLRLIK